MREEVARIPRPNWRLLGHPYEPFVINGLRVTSSEVGFHDIGQAGLYTGSREDRESRPGDGLQQHPGIPLWQHQPLSPPDSTHRPSAASPRNRATTLSADLGSVVWLIVDGMAEANLRFAQLSSPMASRCDR
jgi:hypothetical protein